MRKNMSNQFVLREEVFGSTLYDKQRLKHIFLNAEETKKVLSGDFEFDGIKVKELEHLESDLDGIRTDIIYSPIRIYYEVTTACNLRCQTCFNKSGKPQEDELSLDEVVRLLGGFRRDNIFDIRFTGGEVVTKEGWDQILQHAKDIGFAISLNTNGVYVNDGVLDKIARIMPHQVTISIDGMRETNDSIRGRGSFDKAYATLLALHEKGVPLRTNTLITRAVTQEAEEMIDFFKPYVKDMAFFNMRIMGRALEMVNEAVSYDELRAFNDHMDEVVTRHPEVHVHYKEPATTYNSIKQNNELGLQTGRCPGGLTRLVMTSNGDMHTCGYMPYINPDDNTPGANLGNAVQERYTTLKIWRESRALDDFRKINEEHTRKCLSCSQYDMKCPGVCLADEFNRIHSLDKKNPYCLDGD